MAKLLLVALGGAFGSAMRYLCAEWAQRLGGGPFPYGTLAVNVIGCLCIGVLGALFAGPHAPKEAWRLALVVGVLGGFTTFSAFGLDVFLLAEKGKMPVASAYFLLTNGLCLMAVWAAYRVTERVAGAS